MNPDLVKRVLDLVSTVRKTAIGESTREEDPEVDSLVDVRLEADRQPSDARRDVLVLVIDSIESVAKMTAAHAEHAEALRVMATRASSLRALTSMPATGATVVTSLHEIIDEARGSLHQRARRLFALEPLAKQLTTLSRDKYFDIHNDILWTMMLDSRDKLVIDLADWAKASYAKGTRGFLRLIQSHHLGELGRRRTWALDNAERAERCDFDRVHAEARARLFPSAGDRTRQEDAVGLVETFASRFEALLNDRHANRAHSYEHERSRGASVRMLDFTEMRALVEYAHGVILDLSLVAFGSSFDLDDRNAADADEVAEDLAESILLPSHVRKRHLGEHLTVDALLADLHAHDTTLPQTGTVDCDGTRRPTFNDHRAVSRSLERMGRIRQIPDRRS